MIIGAKPSVKVINLKDHPAYDDYKEAFDSCANPGVHLWMMFDQKVEAVRYQTEFWDFNKSADEYGIVFYGRKRIVRIDFQPVNPNRQVELLIFVSGPGNVYSRKITSGETLDLPILMSNRFEEESYIKSDPVKYFIRKKDVKGSPLATLIEYCKDERYENLYKRYDLEERGFKKDY